MTPKPVTSFTVDSTAYVVCDDGSVYKFTGTGWIEWMPLPDSQADTMKQVGQTAYRRP